MILKPILALQLIFSICRNIGGGGKMICLPPQYFHWGGGGGRLPPQDRRLWADRIIAQSCSFVPFCRRAWCHNNYALRISVDLRDHIAHWIVLWMKYALVVRWLCLTMRKKKNEIWLGTRILSLINWCLSTAITVAQLVYTVLYRSAVYFNMTMTCCLSPAQLHAYWQQLFIIHIVHDLYIMIHIGHFIGNILEPVLLSDLISGLSSLPPSHLMVLIATR